MRKKHFLRSVISKGVIKKALNKLQCLLCMRGCEQEKNTARYKERSLENEAKVHPTNQEEGQELLTI